MASGSRKGRARRVLSASFGVALAALAATHVTPVLADDAQATGRALFNEGVALFNRGEFDTACPKFEASLKAFPGIGTRGKLAECYEKLGRFASAWQAYRDVAQLATKSGDVTREQVAAERAKALEPKLSYVTVVVPPGRDTSGLVVKRGGKDLERSKYGLADPVDQGAITFEVSAPGKKTYSGQIAVTQGQSVKFELPVLQPLEAPRVVPVEPPPPPQPTDTQPLPVQTDPPQWQKPTAFVAMGLGVLGLGIGGGFGLAASSTYDSAFDGGGGCSRADNSCDAAGQKKVDDAHSQASAATAMFVVGTLLAGAGVVLYFTAPSSKTAGMHVAPTVGGLVVGGSL